MDSSEFYIQSQAFFYQSSDAEDVDSLVAQITEA